jgi:aryl-alcohol dehydrogenase-like predicted oxidoreductase
MNDDTYLLAGRQVHRMGFGAMQLPGPHVFGPPRNRQNAVEVLRHAVRAGVNHIDTAQFYGPDVANELIRDALYPYPEDLVLVSKVGASRDDSGGIHAAQRPEQLREGVLANLESLQLDQVPIVNLRRHPEAGVAFDEQVAAMVAMRDEGLIGGFGLSNVTLEEYRAARLLAEVACVQNAYNLTDRLDQALFDTCAAEDVPYVPFFPLGSGFNPQNPVLTAPPVVGAATRLGVTAAQIALAWLLSISPNVLLIPGTSNLQHLRENLAAAELRLDAQTLSEISTTTPQGWIR